MTLSDDEIAEKLALAMGWTTRMYCTVQIFVEDGNDGDDWDCSEATDEECKKEHHRKFQELRYYDSDNKRVKVSKFSPATRWDHIGIVIEFMESLDEHTYLTIFVDDFRGGDQRWLQFRAATETNIGFNQPLTPRHIALAALAALREDGSP